VKAGGTIQGEIDALNRVLDMVIPPFPLAWQEGRTYVVPATGGPLDFVDLGRLPRHDHHHARRWFRRWSAEG